MSKTKILALGAICTLALTMPAWAQNGVQVAGYGTQSCGAWTTARRSNQTDMLMFSSWMAGYLSGFALENKLDILRGTDMPALQGWLDNWCGAHPLEPFYDGVDALGIELIKRMPPKPAKK
jgi:hypothetical protein